jgi:hypothetical protein
MNWGISPSSSGSVQPPTTIPSPVSPGSPASVLGGDLIVALVVPVEGAVAVAAGVSASGRPQPHRLTESHDTLRAVLRVLVHLN